jgi:hypothetical protein
MWRGFIYDEDTSKARMVRVMGCDYDVATEEPGRLMVRPAGFSDPVQDQVKEE